MDMLYAIVCSLLEASTGAFGFKSTQTCFAMQHSHSLAHEEIAF
jgi:hypothetical protein